MYLFVDLFQLFFFDFCLCAAAPQTMCLYRWVCLAATSEGVRSARNAVYLKHTWTDGSPKYFCILNDPQSGGFSNMNNQLYIAMRNLAPFQFCFVCCWVRCFFRWGGGLLPAINTVCWYLHRQFQIVVKHKYRPKDNILVWKREKKTPITPGFSHQAIRVCMRKPHKKPAVNCGHYIHHEAVCFSNFTEMYWV